MKATNIVSIKDLWFIVHNWMTEIKEIVLQAAAAILKRILKV